MIVDFRQGIVTYPSSGPLASNQQFLAYSGGNVTLQATYGRTDVAFAHGVENYLYSESSDVNNAWIGVPTGNVWLYWDINLRTAIRTFGFTTVTPIVSTSEPAHITDQHWFNLLTYKMLVYSGGWREVARVFAARINSGIFYPMGSLPNAPFAGSQVGLSAPGTPTGRIVIDNVGVPIRRTNGQLFTTESDIFVQGSPVNVVRLESNVITATAVESIAEFQVVKFSGIGQIGLALYGDTQNTVIAMCMESLINNETGTVCVQGTIANPQWNWSTIGANLWIHGTIPGTLTNVDPHISDPITNLTGYPPVARVLSATSIVFDQGMGGKGERGLTGPPGTGSADTVATTPYEGLTGTTVTVQLHQLYDQIISGGSINLTGGTGINVSAPFGNVTISNTGVISFSGSTTGLTPNTATTGAIVLGGTLITTHGGTGASTAPTAGQILVGTTGGAYVPYTLASGAGISTTIGPGTLQINNIGVTQIVAGTGITLSPIGGTGAVTVTSTCVPIAGGTMTGYLILNADPIATLGAATKTYVDSKVNGLTWLNPIFAPDVIDDSVLSPPISPTLSTTYIINGVGTGIWAGYDGHALTFNGTGSPSLISSWTDELGRALIAGDRFGIALEHGVGLEGGSFLLKANNIVQIASGTPGTYVYTYTIPIMGQAVFVNNVASDHFGHSYTYTGAMWIEFSGPSATPAGVGLYYTGSTLNVSYAPALHSATTIVDVSAAVAPTTGQVLTATDSTHATWQTPSGGGGPAWTIKTTTYLAVANDGIFADTIGGAFTVTLPATPTLGDTVSFADVASMFNINNLTIARNGLKIMGVAADMVVNTQNMSFSLVYSNSTYGWRIVQ